MLSIALTGAIGSGKSTVLRLLRKQGIPAIDCDAIVRRLYRQPNVKKALKKEFGSSGRKKIAEIVFSSAKKRRKLQEILHPMVWNSAKKSLAGFRKAGKKAAVVEVPLLFEAGWQRRFCCTIVVFATKKQCLCRLERKGIPRKEALLRMKAQFYPSEKAGRADFLVNNTKSLGRTMKQVKRIAEKIRAAG
jgi:dephospho-CoA kinase